jgi:hypothetical protein
LLKGGQKYGERESRERERVRMSEGRRKKEREREGDARKEIREYRGRGDEGETNSTD